MWRQVLRPDAAHGVVHGRVILHARVAPPRLAVGDVADAEHGLVAAAAPGGMEVDAVHDATVALLPPGTERQWSMKWTPRPTRQAARRQPARTARASAGVGERQAQGNQFLARTRRAAKHRVRDQLTDALSSLPNWSRHLEASSRASRFHRSPARERGGLPTVPITSRPCRPPMNPCNTCRSGNYAGSLAQA